jgi:hypothetical protein
MSLAEYIHNYLPSAGLHNLMTKQLAGVVANHSLYDASRLAAITLSPETMLAEAKKNLEYVIDFFGLLERFDDSVRLFMVTFGARGGSGLRAYAIHRSLPYLHPHPDLRAEIAHLNSLDAELYDFAVELFERRLREHKVYEKNFHITKQNNSHWLPHSHGRQGSGQANNLLDEFSILWQQ